jgi:hypothetical protein
MTNDDDRYQNTPTTSQRTGIIRRATHPRTAVDLYNNIALEIISLRRRTGNLVTTDYSLWIVWGFLTMCSVLNFSWSFVSSAMTRLVHDCINLPCILFSKIRVTHHLNLNLFGPPRPYVRPKLSWESRDQIEGWCDRWLIRRRAMRVLWRFADDADRLLPVAWMRARLIAHFWRVSFFICPQH